MITGIVTIEKTVVIDTSPTERSTSLSNLVANIVVVAATGAEAAIVQEMRISPLTPQSDIKSSDTHGTAISLNADTAYTPGSRSALRKFTWERW
jgi:hypothetical protein